MLSEEDKQGFKPIHTIKQIEEEDLILTYMCKGNHCKNIRESIQPQDEVKIKAEKMMNLNSNTRSSKFYYLLAKFNSKFLRLRNPPSLCDDEFLRLEKRWRAQQQRRAQQLQSRRRPTQSIVG